MHQSQRFPNTAYLRSWYSHAMTSSRYNIIRQYIYMQHIFRMCQPLPYFSKTSWCNGAQVLPTFRSQISPFLYMAVSGNGVSRMPAMALSKMVMTSRSSSDEAVDLHEGTWGAISSAKPRFLFNSFGICYVWDPERDRNALGSTMTRWVFKFGSQGHAVPEGAIPLELCESWLPRISSE